MLFILDQEIADINPSKVTRHIAIHTDDKKKKKVNLDVNMNYLEKVNGKMSITKAVVGTMDYSYCGFKTI